MTDIQRLLVIFAVVVALFLAAMAWGGSSLVLLLVSVGLLVASGLAVFLLGLRHNPRQPDIVTAFVVSVAPPPPGVIVGKCDMKLRLNVADGRSLEVRVKEPAVPLTRWPQPGQALPVEVDPGDARRPRVRWDLVDLGYVPAPVLTPSRSFPTPRRDPMPTVRLYERYADPSLNDDYGAEDDDDATVRSPAPADDPYATASGAENGHDPDGYEPTDFEQIRSVPTEFHHPDFDPADVDRSDFAPDLPARTVPLPRPSKQPTLRVTEGGADVPADAPHPPARPSGAIGGTLFVSDLERSLHFYSEKLGFTIVYSAGSNAVVEYGGARVLLQHMADFTGIDHRVGHLDIQVPDVEAAHIDLVRKGIEFSHRPKVVSRSDDVELWKATFRDPDGHGIALAEWRQRG
jgi:resuscitation-promoting factor RpfA